MLGRKTKPFSTKFDLSEMEREFRHIRNRLRKYYPDEIIAWCIRYLTGPDSNKIETIRRYEPWKLLLLIKWTLLYGEHSASKLRTLNQQDFDYLNRLMYELSGRARLPNQYSNVFLFFRNLAFQQFWLQEPFNAQRFARQYALFGHLDKGHSFNKFFEQEIGISINEFLELSLMLLSRSFNQPAVFKDEWFSTIEKSFPPGTVRKFLKSLSLNITSSRDYLREFTDQQKTNISYELYEQTPLRRYPLLQDSDSYIFYSRNLLYHGLQNFVYDILRSSDPSAFMGKFGLVFEKYVEKAIQYTGLPNLSENILSSLDKGNKSVDFLIVDKDINVLIDAKGVEMGYLGMVSHIPDVIRDKSKSSIVKGIQQGYSTAKSLAQQSIIDGVQIGKRENFLILVTFKDLFIGSGKDFHDYIASETFAKMQTEFDAEKLIPAENMYFISIDDLDQLVECIHCGQSLSEILHKAVENDRAPSTKKFVFRQHLEESFPHLIKVPSYLVNEYQQLIEKTKNRFPEN